MRYTQTCKELSPWHMPQCSLRISYAKWKKPAPKATDCRICSWEITSTGKSTGARIRPVTAKAKDWRKKCECRTEWQSVLDKIIGLDWGLYNTVCIKNLLLVGSRLLLTVLVGKLHPKNHQSRCEVSSIGNHVLVVALFTLAKIQDQPRCPSAEEVRKKHRHIMESYTWKTQNKTHRNHRSSGKWLDLEIAIMLSAISQTQMNVECFSS